MKIECDKVDITNFITTFTWSGSAYQAARTLDFTVINSLHDKSIQVPDIKLGAVICLYDDNNKLLFYGTVNSRERASNIDTIVYSAYDKLNHLLRSNGIYKFINTTPEAITKKVCGDLKIKTGTIAETKVPIFKMIVDGESYYNIILAAYTKAFHSNGKKYMIKMDGDKLSVVEKGELIENFILDEKENIQASNYSENLESMINKIKIYDDTGTQVGEVKKEEWISLYGIYQDVYTKEENVNATKTANNLLFEINKTASIEANGNVKCISGYAIRLKDGATKLSGKFWIESDSHVWENGNHTMSLGLVFKNIMDLVESEEEEDAATKKVQKKQSLTKNSLVWITLGGDKYHLQSNCSGMKGAKQLKLYSAEMLKKTACKKCIG